MSIFCLNIMILHVYRQDSRSQYMNIRTGHIVPLFYKGFRATRRGIH